jgi:hypothetical protein
MSLRFLFEDGGMRRHSDMGCDNTATRQSGETGMQQMGLFCESFPDGIKK